MIVTWLAAARMVIGFGLAEVRPDVLRVYGTEPDTFDYVFKSYAEVAGKSVMLSFNHRSGKTFFVKPGDRFDAYTVAAFEPAVREVFDPTLNAARKTKTGKVTLTGPDKSTLVLEMDNPLRQSGLRARIVSLETGNQWSVRAGDRIAEGAVTVPVVEVTEAGAKLDWPGLGLSAIAPASEKEKVALHVLWREQSAEKQAAVAAAAAAGAAVARGGAGGNVAMGAAGNAGQQAVVVNAGNLAAGRVVGAAGTQPSFHYGTDYRYPTEYEIWYVRQGKDGRIRPIVVPTKFETRELGMQVGPGSAVSWTSVEPSPLPYASHGQPLILPQPRFSRMEFKTKP